MEILPLFCEIDDFLKVFEKLYDQPALAGSRRCRQRRTRSSQPQVKIRATAVAVRALYVYWLAKRGANTSISVIDATPLKVCHNLRMRHTKFVEFLRQSGVGLDCLSLERKETVA